MRKQFPTLLLTALLLPVLLSCSHRQEDIKNIAADSTLTRLPGDSCIYGLACDGCNDTLLIVLTDVAADPDTFQVLTATEEHQVFGRPRIGDRLAVLPSSDDMWQAAVVVNLEQMKGTWCYEVRPQLRERAGITAEMRERLEQRMPDSVRRKLLAPREYGFRLESGNVVVPVGNFREAEHSANSPVIYEKPPRYQQWHVLNGKLLLTEVRRDAPGQAATTKTDTATFVALRRDTLVLSIGGKQTSYYRKEEKKAQ